MLWKERTPLPVDRPGFGRHGDIVRLIVLAEKIGDGQLEVRGILPLEHVLHNCYTCTVVVAFGADVGIMCSSLLCKIEPIPLYHAINGI